MKVWGLTKEEIELIVSIISARDYEKNIMLEYEPKALTNGKNTERGLVRCYQVKLRCVSSKQPGSRLNWKMNRRLIACSWEVFRDVIREMFEQGAKRVQTAMADYRSKEDFEDKYKATRHRNMGSQLCPAEIGQLTNYDFEGRK